MKVLRKDGSVLLAECRATENAWERFIGLLPRSSLAEGEGLWLRPCNSVHTFFMRFPMDAAFLDRSGKVIKVYRAMKPWRHSLIHFFAVGVLEAGAGALASVQEGEVLQVCSFT